LNSKAKVRQKKAEDAELQILQMLVQRLQMPHKEITNSECRDEKRRTRKWQTPHAEMAIPARGNCQRRTRGF
jgi:hypothetical protein